MFADTTCWFLTYPTAAWQRSTTVHKADGGGKKDRQTKGEEERGAGKGRDMQTRTHTYRKDGWEVVGGFRR